MKRTTLVPAVLPLYLAAVAALPGSSAAQAEPAQAPAIQAVVDKLRAQEALAQKVRIALHTEGSMPGEVAFATDGTLRVLRSEQGELVAVQTKVTYRFGDELSGTVETVRTPDGVVTFEQSPTVGQLFLKIDKSVMADLEWAGRVLQRNDLPGLGDARAAAPLGSSIVADLARRYALEPLSRREHDGQLGTWYGGDRRTGLGLEEDPDLPLADRVELFVRAPDDALMEVVHLREGQVLQRITVKELVVGESMPLDSFRIEIEGKKPIDVREHTPTWEQVQQLIQQAKDRRKGEPDGKDALPPSERAK